MKPVQTLTTALLFLGLAGSAFAYTAQGNSDKQDKQDKPAEKQGKGKPASQGKQEAKPAGQGQGRGQQQAEKPSNEKQQRQSQQRQQTVEPAQQQNRGKAEAITPAQQYGQQHPDRRTRQVQQQPVRAQDQLANRPPGWDKGKKTGWNGGSVPPGQQGRLPQERQQQLITQQRQSVVVYRQRLGQQYTLGQRYAIQLQTDRHMASYRYQQAYIARLRQQELAMQRYNNYNYSNDPYYYTAPSYRYDRGGTSYEINQYGADTLRQAINNGYNQGFQAGQAARQDRWSNGYQDSYGYQDANYGYDGRYSDQDSYNYYFRQGFQRGYDDGYNSRTQYGSYSNGRGSILANVLGTILNLQSMR